MDFFVHEDALTPIKVLKLVLESCSGLPCFPFRISLAIGENWSSTKRFMGAISPTYFDIIQGKKKKSFFKLSDRLHLQQSLVEEPHWSLPHLLLRGNVCTGSGLSAESHFHQRLVFWSIICPFDDWAGPLFCHFCHSNTPSPSVWGSWKNVFFSIPLGFTTPQGVPGCKIGPHLTGGETET